MRINPIQQNQNCLNTNFKGTVTPEATQIIQNIARDEAKNYVLCLGKGVKADKEVLLGVQKYWNAILKKLNTTFLHKLLNYIYKILLSD